MLLNQNCSSHEILALCRPLKALRFASTAYAALLRP